MGNYVCIYPNEGSNHYDYFFINQKPVNQAIYEFLYDQSRGYLKELNPEIISDVAMKLNFRDIESKKYYSEQSSPVKSAMGMNKIGLSIQDYMLEYVTQVAGMLKEFKNKALKTSWKEQIDQ